MQGIRKIRKLIINSRMVAFYIVFEFKTENNKDRVIFMDEKGYDNTKREKSRNL